MKRIAIIGGGAAGFMAAITAQEQSPSAEVILFEKTNKILSKVKVSGGGRCNVTNACASISELVKKYPRGGRQLKKSFGHFFTIDTIKWFEEKGVPLKTEADGRMFPESNSSQTIVDCLTKTLQQLGVRLATQSAVTQITPLKKGFELTINKETLFFDKVILATGGSPKLSGLDWLANLGYQIETPVPSLFTFNMPKESIKELMGVVAPNALVRIQGEKLQQEGPLLITHWGMSGPAILKTSAFGARKLADKKYQFTIQINWANLNEEAYKSLMQEQGNKKLAKNPFELPNRLWLFLLNQLELNGATAWSQLGKKDRNRLLNTLLNDTYQVNGKTTFKEEFVTCGGVSLSNINMSSMESKLHPEMFFAGELLDIDGVTGGFNFQAAWTTGYLAGKNSVA